MQIFISWSGDKSREFGELLRNWIPNVLQSVEPYFTPNDVEKGNKWQSEIAAKLEKSHIGLLCLTRESLSKPWLIFEAGALSKSLSKSKVCPILFGIEPADLEGPLVQFQATRFKKNEIRSLMSALNKECGEQGGTKLAEDTFSRVFDKWWPELETEIDKALEATEPPQQETEIRSDREIIEEVLLLTRQLNAKKPRSVESLPSKLFEDVFNGYAELVSQVSAREAHEKIMEQLEDMHSAMNFLAGRVWGEDERLSIYRRSLRNLTFKMSERNFDPIDEEIPF